MPFLAIWKQFCVVFQSMLSLTYKSIPSVVQLLQIFVVLGQICFAACCNLLAWIITLLCVLVFSGLFFGKGGVVVLFTKQLCFIGSHKAVQYLVNCFSDHQVIPAFWKQMKDTSLLAKSLFKSCFRIGIPTTSRGFTIYHHAVSQDQVYCKRFPIIGRKITPLKDVIA